jgi:hypothetical protein
MAKIWMAMATALLLTSAYGQAARDGERPPRPADASNARIGGWCDALTGAKKEQCLRDERRKEHRSAKGQAPHGKCDALTGVDRERCLKPVTAAEH